MLNSLYDITVSKTLDLDQKLFNITKSNKEIIQIQKILFRGWVNEY